MSPLNTKWLRQLAQPKYRILGLIPTVIVVMLTWPVPCVRSQEVQLTSPNSSEAPAPPPPATSSANPGAGSGTDASSQILLMQRQMEKDKDRTDEAMRQMNQQADRDKTKVDAEKAREDIVKGIAKNIH